MNSEVFITCAVTGAGDTTARSHLVPVTPEEIADAALEAAKAGAAIAHIHVRDIETGQGNRDRDAFREAVARVRDSDVDVILNLTTGMGGDYVPDADDPGRASPAPSRTRANAAGSITPSAPLSTTRPTPRRKSRTASLGASSTRSSQKTRSTKPKADA